MYTQTLLAFAAAAGVANASPLLRRQTVATESITSTATVTPSGTSVTSTPGLNPTASTAVTDNGNTYALYPCPPGFSLTYVQNNQTIERGLGDVKESLGEWATAAIFPNVTASQGGSMVGATHTYEVLGASFLETLENSTYTGDDSAFVQWVWNSTSPILAGDLEIATYSTVFKAYDPNFARLGMRSNETTVQIFTNACAANQENARSTLQSLQALQLNQLNGTRASDSTSNGGVLISSVVATNTVSSTNTNTAIDTNTILATATNDVTQTNTLVPLTATSTGTTIQQTVTPVTVAVTSTANTVVSTAATTLVTANNPNTATTVVAVSTTSV